ncbi:N-acetyltransferase family protein [Natronomonas halophila]|uniref:GNAT family N-acetyltransferase n=1 Tax=Natronomonas halophila TaxID=2747817 RepID=UPI0015B62037|nr:GNAT family N-acetyltransferase [Natronomonas halophila]QLD86800.1 N-acetyltransferase family protein [Natronomonas halophila]
MDLRIATRSDAEAIASIYRPYVEETAITFEETPPDAETIADRIADTVETYPWFVAERDGEVVGYAYGGKLRKRAAYRWVVELSVYVDRERRRTGVGSALYRALLSTLEQQGFQSAYGVVTLPNPESVAFHEELGFERTAFLPESGYKLGEWHDVAWFERALGEGRPENPTDPTPFSACRDAAWLDTILADVSAGAE